MHNGKGATLTFDTHGHLMSARAKVITANKHIGKTQAGQHVTMFLDCAKTKSELRPAMLTHRACDILSDLEKEKVDAALVLSKDMRGKSVKLGQERCGYSLNGIWQWTQVAVRRHSVDELQMASAYVNGYLQRGDTKMPITALSANVGKKLGDVDSQVAFLQDLARIGSRWDVLYIAEVDGRLSDGSISNLFGGTHTWKRYWPGVGSYAFGLVFKNTFTGLVKSLTFCCRAALCVASVASDALSTAGNGAGAFGIGTIARSTSTGVNLSLSMEATTTLMERLVLWPLY